MFDPMHRMLQSKADNQQANLIRNRMQLRARSIMQKGYQVLNGDDIKAMLSMKGRIEEYIELRQCLSPQISQDGYSAELAGMLRKLEIKLNQGGL